MGINVGGDVKICESLDKFALELKINLFEIYTNNFLFIVCFVYIYIYVYIFI